MSLLHSQLDVLAIVSGQGELGVHLGFLGKLAKRFVVTNQARPLLFAHFATIVSTDGIHSPSG